MHTDALSTPKNSLTSSSNSILGKRKAVVSYLEGIPRKIARIWYGEPPSIPLPDELLVAIFTDLDKNSFFLVKMVCRQWNEVSNDLSLKKHFIRKFTPTFYAELSPFSNMDQQEWEKIYQTSCALAWNLNTVHQDLNKIAGRIRFWDQTCNVIYCISAAVLVYNYREPIYQFREFIRKINDSQAPAFINYPPHYQYRMLPLN